MVLYDWKLNKQTNFISVALLETKVTKYNAEETQKGEEEEEEGEDHKIFTQ